MTVSEGFVFDIRRYAIHDGPGIRITFFFKGCNLRCSWCHNPEGISPRKEKMYAVQRCIGCGTCIAACPAGALNFSGDTIITAAELCTHCGVCAGVCPSKAFEMSGSTVSLDMIVSMVEREKVFLDQSGGGVTFSGGEPLLQWPFLLEALRECGRLGVHRAVDTAGNVATDLIMKVAEHTDLFLFDLKIMDSERHREATGVPNRLILDNLRQLSAANARIIIRIPLIPGVNTDEMNMRQTAQFLRSLPNPVEEVQLLPFHPAARQKYVKLGMAGAFAGYEEPDEVLIEQCSGWLSASGVVVT